MSQFGGKMSKFQGKFDIVSTDLRIILSNFVETDVYALFKKSIKKICNMMFKTKGGGGGKGFLNNVQKNYGSGGSWLPLRDEQACLDMCPQQSFFWSISGFLPKQLLYLVDHDNLPMARPSHPIIAVDIFAPSNHSCLWSGH